MSILFKNASGSNSKRTYEYFEALPRARNLNLGALEACTLVLLPLGTSGFSEVGLLFPCNFWDKLWLFSIKDDLRIWDGGLMEEMGLEWRLDANGEYEMNLNYNEKC